MNHAPLDRNLDAPEFGLLVGEMPCWQCRQATKVAALWVASSRVWHEPDEEPEEDDEPGVLTYVQDVSEHAADLLRATALPIRLTATHGSGITYLANHCQSCDSVQGDNYVHGADGAFFPQTESALRSMNFIPRVGGLEAKASLSSSSWMSRVRELVPVVLRTGKDT
jgi:hypothetical protein